MMTQRTIGVLPINSVRRTFDDLIDRAFDSLISGTQGVAPQNVQPRPLPIPVNLWEDDEYVVVECELPGFRIEDIELTVVDNVLTLSGQRHFLFPENANVRLRERVGERFHREINVPVPIEVEGASAQLQSGILRVSLPKAQQARLRRIEVRAE